MFGALLATMKHRLCTFFIATACAVAFSFARGADAEADAAWKKVETAMDSLKKPAVRPTSREEAMAFFKKGITTTDEAGKTFLDKYPNDPRRWTLRLFDGQTAQAREALGIPLKGDQATVLAEILKATDADSETKGEASALTLESNAAKVKDGSMTEADWIKSAEAHLKAFPNCEQNKMIAGTISGIKTLAELKTKPLELKFTAVDGHEIDLANMKGKVVLIDFWATWCGPCVAELPNVLKAYEKLHGKGFEIVGISLDSEKEKLESFTKEKGMTWPQYFDGKGWENEVSTRLGIRSIPAMWLVNKKGMVVSTDARGKLEELVEKNLAE